MTIREKIKAEFKKKGQSELAMWEIVCRLPHTASSVKRVVLQMNDSGELIQLPSGYYKLAESADTTTQCGVSNEAILKAAATSPEAKAALEKLFPQLFKAQSKYLELGVGMGSLNHGNFIESVRSTDDEGCKPSFIVANGLAPNKELIRRSVYVYYDGNGPYNTVVFDSKGNRVFSTAEKLFIAFEKVK